MIINLFQWHLLLADASFPLCNVMWQSQRKANNTNINYTLNGMSCIRLFRHIIFSFEQQLNVWNNRQINSIWIFFRISDAWWSHTLHAYTLPSFNLFITLNLIHFIDISCHMLKQSGSQQRKLTSDYAVFFLALIKWPNVVAKHAMVVGQQRCCPKQWFQHFFDAWQTFAVVVILWQ